MSINLINLLGPFAASNSSGITVLQSSKIVIDTSTVTSCIVDPSYPTHGPGYPSYPGQGGYGGDGYTTVYTTEYVQVCPTETPCPKGTKTETYTITETCTGSKEDYTRPAIPDHFTTIETVCQVCAGKPTLTVTCPNPNETAGSHDGISGGNGNGGNGYPGNGGNKNPANGNAGNGYPGNGGNKNPGNGGSESPKGSGGNECDGKYGHCEGGTGKGGNGNSGNSNGGYQTPDSVHPTGSVATSTGKMNPYDGYIQSSQAYTQTAGTISLLLGSLIGVAAWLL